MTWQLGFGVEAERPLPTALSVRVLELRLSNIYRFTIYERAGEFRYYTIFSNLSPFFPLEHIERNLTKASPDRDNR